MKLNLDDGSAPVLLDILRNYYSDLRMEIADTENRDFRQQLKRREAIVESLIQQIEPDTASRVA